MKFLIVMAHPVGHIAEDMSISKVTNPVFDGQLFLRHFNSMGLQHVISKGLDTSVYDTTYFTGVSAICPCMHFIPVTGQESLSNTPVAADVADVFRFPDVHHVHVILEVALGRKFLFTEMTHNFAISSIVNVVDFVKMIIVKENTDIFLAVLAKTLGMARSEV